MTMKGPLCGKQVLQEDAVLLLRRGQPVQGAEWLYGHRTAGIHGDVLQHLMSLMAASTPITMLKFRGSICLKDQSPRRKQQQERLFFNS